MADSPDAPSTLGPYRLESLLGRGGMGEVWAARDTRLDRRVAIKQLRASALGEDDDSKIRARFRREAWAAAKIAHPAVVPVFDVVEDAAGDWIVMELVDGPTLRARIDEHGPLDVDTALRWGRQIAEGLAAAHREGLVHRDLKTENVMIASSGHAKILDFGLAKQLAKSDDEATITVSGEVMGTVRCMSPEQARGFSVDARSDLFSLGTLLYEVLTGDSPFRGETPLDTLSRVVTHEPVSVRSLRPDVPAELSTLVDRLLEKAPERRPQTADEVAGALEAILLGRGANASAGSASNASAWDGETLTDEGVSIDGAPSVAGSRRWTTVLGGIAALVAVALAIAWFAGRTEPPSEPVTDRATVAEPVRAVDVDPQSFTSAYDAYLHGQELLERYDRKGYLPAAIEAFRRAVALDAEHAAAHAGLARALLFEYRTRTDPMWLDQATQAARRAVALDDHLAASLTSSALVAIEQSDLDTARQAVDQALRIAPSDADVHFVAGELATKEGDPQAALAAFRRAIELRRSAESRPQRARPDLPEHRPARRGGGRLHPRHRGRRGQRLQSAQPGGRLPDARTLRRSCPATSTRLGNPPFGEPLRQSRHTALLPRALRGGGGDLRESARFPRRRATAGDVGQLGRRPTASYPAPRARHGTPSTRRSA